ncbi:MAG: tetratricopeptide repeat protein, partial [Leptolyngbya sp. SIO4C5]|nr:tetratricopeptide repeat protein [Leptolyngbya sp. SIO4C5]
MKSHFLAAISFSIIVLLTPIKLLSLKAGSANAAGIRLVSPELERRQNEEKLRELEKVIRLCQLVNTCTDEAELLRQVSSLHFELGQYQQIIYLFSQILQEERETGLTKAEILGEMSNAHFKLGQYQQVIHIFSQALNEARKADSEQSEQQLLEVMATKLQDFWNFKAGCGVVADFDLRQRYQDGEISWQEVIEIAEVNLFVGKEIQNRVVEIDSLHSLG